MGGGKFSLPVLVQQLVATHLSLLPLNLLPPILNPLFPPLTHIVFAGCCEW